MASRNQREGRFTGHSARGCTKWRETFFSEVDDCRLPGYIVHVHHRYRTPPEYDKILRRAMSLDDAIEHGTKFSSIPDVMEWARKISGGIPVDLSVLMPESSAAPTSEADMRAYHERQWLTMSRPKTREGIWDDFMSAINQQKKDFGL